MRHRRLIFATLMLAVFGALPVARAAASPEQTYRLRQR